MSLKSRNLKDTIGAEITITVDDLLLPEVAREVRELLVDRGFLSFPSSAFPTTSSFSSLP